MFNLLEMSSEPIVKPLVSEDLGLINSRSNLESVDTGSLDVGRSEQFEITRLLKALGDFGLKPSTPQLIELQEKLSVNCNKFVRFGDFVEVVKDIFHKELSDMNTVSGDNASNYKFFIHDQSQKSHDLILENSNLKDEIRILKKQLKSMENACLHTEIDLLATKKELQNCIECIRKLKGEDQIEVERLPGAADCVMNKESCMKQKYNNNPDTRKENAHLMEEIERLRYSNSVFKATSYKLIYFLEELQSKLVEPLQTPRNKVGRSFSLYRNTANGAGMRNVTTHAYGAVARAASVCTPLKGNFQGTMKQIQHDTLPEMIKKMKEILAVSKEIMKTESHGRQAKEIQHGSLNSLCGSPFINPLRGLPPKMTITIMSRV